MINSGKVVLFIATSLDGFIAKSDGDIGFLDKVAKEGEDYGYGEFMKQIAVVILGRKTHDKVVSMGFEAPYGDLPTYVITHTPKQSEGTIEYYTGDIVKLIFSIKATAKGNIFVDGGAGLVNNMLKQQLIDEIIISIIPVMLGSGIRLFENDNFARDLKLLNCKQFETGLVQLHYSFVK